MVNGHLEHAFGALLSEKFAELEAEETSMSQLVGDMAFEELLHAAQQSVYASEAGPLPRCGHGAYLVRPESPLQPGARQLDILH